MNSRAEKSTKIRYIEINIICLVQYLRPINQVCTRCAVANMLVTNCQDNISRVWCETVLPDDGLISLQQLDPAASQVKNKS